MIFHPYSLAIGGERIRRAI